MVIEIASKIKKLKPEILINVHAVPWRQNDFNGAIKIVTGQDFAAISEHADFLSPMCYHHMVKRTPAWIDSVVKDIHDCSQKNCKLIPSIQVKEAYLTENLTSVVFEEALKAALNAPSRGVVFWNWQALANAPEKKQIVKTIVKNY